ncbi:LuxR C-terminal-related transcriptional regulator [Streptomyces sp. NPDC056004]|uniref:helix-turn-helix transcriptional regulator n=1 Tax=Streptomyces sp. NPDC056004 TaxID=3345677 RepID=UPI0035D577E6
MRLGWVPLHPVGRSGSPVRFGGGGFKPASSVAAGFSHDSARRDRGKGKDFVSAAEWDPSSREGRGVAMPVEAATRMRGDFHLENEVPALIKNLTARARSEIILCGDSPACMTLLKSFLSQRGFVNPGVRTRMLLGSRCSNAMMSTGPLEMDLVMRSTRCGVETFMSFDGVETIIPAGGVGSASFMEVNSRELGSAVRESFQQQWESLADTGNASHGFDNAQRFIIHGISSGMTDEAIAKRLGVSSRTVRRNITRMMESFQARSRLDLGRHLADVGFFADTPGLNSSTPC